MRSGRTRVLENKDGYMVVLEPLRQQSGGGWVITVGGQVLSRQPVEGAYRFIGSEETERGRFDNGIQASNFWYRNRASIMLGKEKEAHG